jgi:hypothetical protein
VTGHISAGFGQRNGDGLTQPGRCARYQRYLVIEFE